MLALSSLSKSARFVGIMYVGIMFFTKAIFGVLYAHHGIEHGVVDLVRRRSGAGRRRDLPAQPRYATPWPVSLLVIVGLIVVSLSILERRVRGVEVVT